MRIAQIAPIIESVPPKKYGGTERVVYHLTEELVRRGHDVTLFASGDSQTSAKLVSVTEKALRESQGKCRADGADALSLLNIGLAYHRQQEFDIIHDHTHVIGLSTANLATTPVIVTLHDPVFPNYKPLLETFTNPNIVTISHSQGKPAPKMNKIGTVYNGLSMQHYPFSTTSKGYLLFVGSFRKEKGADKAVQVARMLDMPLIIAGKLDEEHKEFFNTTVKPYLSEKIHYVGEVDETARNNLMKNALCFLHPISWMEPFGLTLIEAMACGTPVIGFNLGSIPEIVQHGKTGYVVETIEEMADAIKKIKSINRRHCRSYALENFSSEKMTDEYESLYAQLVRNDTLTNQKVIGRVISRSRYPSM